MKLAVLLEGAVELDEICARVVMVLDNVDWLFVGEGLEADWKIFEL